ncbi:SRPBCC family protein [Actinophytocola sp.]|uniref:SRPBCC family protein n=1 Tax=Actinophytocola sp. TaxID=1872138 RepID=UPI002D7EEEC2|nr:SRPBCC family protein [Actinophytocola sp.]HET9144452.1 SRPBCC family protein [Actinophytocola sp.]
MTQQAERAGISVRKTVTVRASLQRAFTVFTEGFATWWPESHHIGDADLAEAVIEPRTGGRFYERGVDGSECDWGRVLAFEPPDRVVLSWHLQGDWDYDPDPAKASEVEVRFIAEAPDRTRVELEHRHIERHDGAEDVRSGVDSEGGWGGILAGYAVVVTEPTAG